MLQTRGMQRVVVPHQQVNVGPGGQAIVAGELTPGSRVGGVEGEMAYEPQTGIATHLDAEEFWLTRGVGSVGSSDSATQCRITFRQTTSWPPVHLEVMP
jgi:hypothetical protein